MPRAHRRLALAVGLLALSPCHAFDRVIDSPMYQAPALPAPPVVMVFPEGAKALWLKALERPEADLRCKAAGAIALAHRRGFEGMDTTIPALVAALDREDQHPTARLAMAQTLVALEARQAAPSLLRQAEAAGGDFRDLVEPALARWDYRPARAVWMARLGEPSPQNRRGLVLSIRGLAAVGEGQAAERLREMVLSERVAGPLRLEAARALGVLRTEGLEKDAERLTADPSPRGIAARLAAAALLQRHRGEQAIRLLERLAEDAEPAVAASALVRLLDVEPKFVAGAAGRLVTRADARLRSLGVEALRREPSEGGIRLMGGRLDDPGPEVRVQARKALRELAGRKELRERVIEQGTRVLGSDDWRGQEQASILLAEVDHKPAAGRLVELLTLERRPEVHITAAWALRRLAVPASLPGVVRHVEAGQRRLRAAAASPDATTPLIDHQLSQLNQLLGGQKYRDADAVLRQFIPRMERPMSQPVGYESRAAAIWALGLIHEGRSAPDVAKAVEGRLNDVATLPPEDVRVRRMSAAALGRMGAKEALPSLRTYFVAKQPSEDPVNNACGWAIERLTGEAMPKPKPVRRVQRDWFLTPID